MEINGRRSSVGVNDFVFIYPGQHHESLDTDEDEYELFDIKFSTAEPVNADVVPVIPNLLKVANTAGVISALERLTRAKALRQDGNDIVVLVYLAELLMLVSEESRRSSTAVAFESDIDLSIQQAVDYINLHFNEQLRIDDLAGLVHISPSHFAATFKRIIGVSPIEMLIRTRISRAKEFLQYTNFPIKRIASECGFNSTQYFARLFCKREGVSPKDYRANLRPSD